MGILKVAEHKTPTANIGDVIALPTSAHKKQRVVLPTDCGTVDVIKGDLESLSDNAQNFIIENVSSVFMIKRVFCMCMKS